MNGSAKFEFDKSPRGGIPPHYKVRGRARKGDPLEEEPSNIQVRIFHYVKSFFASMRIRMGLTCVPWKTKSFWPFHIRDSKNATFKMSLGLVRWRYAVNN